MTDVRRVLVVTGPGLVADPGLIDQVTEAETAAFGVASRVLATDDEVALRDALDAAGRDEQCALVVLPGPDPAARALLTRPGPHAVRTVWYDLTDTGAVPVTEGSVHCAGRGMWGVSWAIRHAVHRLRHPARRIGYGPDADQWAELRMPTGHAGTSVPVAVLLHGGFWRSNWGADLMDAIAIDLTARGYASWNVEYRRPDRHGWAATTMDVAAALAALPAVVGSEPVAVATGAEPVAAGSSARGAEPAADGCRLDLDRVTVLGHSAGGQLALRLAADGGRLALAVSLAGVLDLVEGERRGIGTAAVPNALGGSREQLPEVYAAADPLSRLPLRVPQVVVQGAGDDLDLVDVNRRYAVAARTAGDEICYLEQPGGHFAVIDPNAEIWHATVAELDRRLRS
ncbi:alpha/beta hydrolase [Micromonospora fulviviridis]|uniref:Alpha/beta hydrolase n=1 Tax=Micromonospora fulviviridis TaxID=47860 RepID=A0ABV2VV55_9ACTN